MTFDSYGWVYPSSPYNYFTFSSVQSWAVMPILFWAIYYYFLLPRNTNKWLGFVINGTAGYVTEFIIGYITAEILHQTMQEWPNSPFKFVGGLSCYCLWLSNAALYYWLVFVMPHHLVDHLDGKGSSEKVNGKTEALAK